MQAYYLASDELPSSRLKIGLKLIYRLPRLKSVYDSVQKSSRPAKVEIAPIWGRAVRDCRLSRQRLAQPFGPEALSNQFRVCSSVQPGTAKPLGTGMRWSWRTRLSGGLRLKRCAVAASAEAHKVINRLTAKTDRIAFVPFNLAAAPRKDRRAIIGPDFGCVLQADHVRTSSRGPSHGFKRWLHDRANRRPRKKSGSAEWQAAGESPILAVAHDDPTTSARIGAMRTVSCQVERSRSVP